MILTDTAYVKLNLALFAAVLLGGCAQSDGALPISSADQACERVMTALVASRGYPADQMVGCDGVESDENSGLYILRLNGACHDSQGCGSVLMGWFAVEASNGAVHVWNVAEWQHGPRIDRT
jgi:hypothetical protein